MPQEYEARRASESIRTSDAYSFDTTANTEHLLREITPADFRESNARQLAERQRNANNPALPQLELCQDRNENFVQNIQGSTFDRNHDGSVSRAELEQTFRDPDVRRTNPSASTTAFALWDNFNKVTRLHNDWFNGNISENDLAALRHSPTDAPAARAINHEISVINRIGLDQAIALRNTFPTPEGP